jgi:hypothetical protein
MRPDYIDTMFRSAPLWACKAANSTCFSRRRDAARSLSCADRRDVGLAGLEWVMGFLRPERQYERASSYDVARVRREKARRPRAARARGVADRRGPACWAAPFPADSNVMGVVLNRCGEH